MKKFLLFLLALPGLALAAGNDMFIQQRDPANAQTLTRTVTVPSADGILGYAFTSAVPGNRVPVVYTFGSGLALSGGAVVALPQAWADISGKPSFAAVATSGSYLDLSNRPATFTPAAHTQAWSTITATPTTLSGYGITDGATAAQLAAKFNTPAGTTAQYVRGDGTLATLPGARRIETYSGTTNASGQITVTYGTAYPAVPVVQPPAPALANQVWTTVSSTTTGFTLQLNQRNTVTLLSVEVLLGATVPVSGTTAQILVVAQ